MACPYWSLDTVSDDEDLSSSFNAVPSHWDMGGSGEHTSDTVVEGRSDGLIVGGAGIGFAVGDLVVGGGDGGNVGFAVGDLVVGGGDGGNVGLDVGLLVDTYSKNIDVGFEGGDVDGANGVGCCV